MSSAGWSFPLRLRGHSCYRPAEQHSKNPERVAAGLKASIKNPHVSEEAKAHAAERLHDLTEERTTKPSTTASRAAEAQSAEPSSRQLGLFPILKCARLLLLKF